MVTKSVAGVCLSLTLAVGGCSRALDHGKAETVIKESPLVRPTDNVSVDAISSTNDTEAVVRASIDGATANLKFRRFDKGWTWEFVETKAGGWVAPEVAMSQIREEHRVVAAAAWAKQNIEPYSTTAKTMYYVALYHVPNPTELANFETWKKLTASLAEMVKKRPDMQDRVAVLTSEQWTDAWGSPISANYNSNDGSTVLTSFGPDKKPGSEDDIVCLNTFQRGYEADGRMIWQREKVWRLPEKLGEALTPFFDKDDDKIEYSKVVKP